MTHMRTLILCLCVALISSGVAAAEQAKAPKKITKPSAVKRAAKPVVAQKFPARKKVIKPLPTKPVVLSKKTPKTPSRPSDLKTSGTKTSSTDRGQERKSIKTA